MSTNGTAFFDHTRTSVGGADENLTFGFTLTTGARVRPHSVTLHYVNPAP